jgi:predicted ATP-dependent endonuclease of OLD family
MKLKSVSIHNFRSIKNAKLNLYDYSLLVGANNVGKTSLLTALRIFYEDEINFNEKSDLPKFQIDDNEIWIEIEFRLTREEFDSLKDEYRSPDSILKVRKYLKSDNKEKVKSGQSNIYGYENGILSENLFYGAKNISQAKLGNVIYIPEVATTGEALKLSGPSPLRNMINFVAKKVVESSGSFQNLTEAFEQFNEKFREEQSQDGFSLRSLVDDINNSLKEWAIKFDININPLKTEEIVKNLISSHIIDNILDKEVDVRNLGQGLQRHIIYTLLRLTSLYVEKKVSKKKEFSPELTLILFEEPEAFLHPLQQEFLNKSLHVLSSQEVQQIIVSTHSPILVSRNIEELPSLIRLRKDAGITRIFQLSEETKNIITQENSELAQYLRSKLSDTSINKDIKEEIKKRLGSISDATRMEEESIRYLLWLDTTRCFTFFADIVLICEGASEKCLIDYLVENKWYNIRERRACILDAMGKYNIHRYMNLFKELGVFHSILLDKDPNSQIHELINEFIKTQKNEYTRGIYFFDHDIETFLGVPPPPENRRDKKPLNLMWHYFKGKINEERINELEKKVDNLLTIT